jgi:hypothetical protein
MAPAYRPDGVFVSGERLDRAGSSRDERRGRDLNPRRVNQRTMSASRTFLRYTSSAAAALAGVNSNAHGVRNGTSECREGNITGHASAGRMTLLMKIDAGALLRPAFEW